MKDVLATTLLPQIDELIEKYQELLGRRKYDDWSGMDEGEASEFVTAGMAAIHRAAGEDSVFAMQASEVPERYRRYNTSVRIPYVAGALKAVRHAIDSGYLVSVQERIHAEVFADFLEMADYCLCDGYKEPAGVLIGGVLEEHLRKLCVKSNLATQIPDSRGVDRPKKAETMNADLAREGVYGKGDQKNITAWLDLRNRAAHGRHDDYDHKEVELFLQAVRHFLTRYPA